MKNISKINQIKWEVYATSENREILYTWICLKNDRSVKRFILRTITTCTVKCWMHRRRMDFFAAASINSRTRLNIFRRLSSHFTTHKWRLRLLLANGLRMTTASILQHHFTIHMGKSSISSVQIHTLSLSWTQKLYLNQSRDRNDMIRCY